MSHVIYARDLLTVSFYLACMGSTSGPNVPPRLPVAFSADVKAQIDATVEVMVAVRHSILCSSMTVAGGREPAMVRGGSVDYAVSSQRLAA